MMRLSSISQHIHTKKKYFCFIFGAPGVGKGTYAKMLEKDLNLVHVSTGNEIRKILKQEKNSKFDPSLIEKIREKVKSGGLISDEIVLKIIEEKIHQNRDLDGVILDGFPRTKQQLSKYLEQFPLHAVFNITLRKDVLIDKLMGRRTCLKCDIGYNVCDVQRDGYSMQPMLPKTEGICDKCGGKLVIRDDDNEKVIQNRMVEYEKQTKPLLQQFEKRKVLINFEPKRGVHDYPKMKTLLQNRRNEI